MVGFETLLGMQSCNFFVALNSLILNYPDNYAFLYILVIINVHSF